MLVFPLTSAWSTTLTKFHKSPAIENSTAQNHFMQQYRYLKYSTTFIMFCLLVHGIFMYLIVTYAIYFKQYFLLMVPHSTFFWNSNICVLFLQLMMIILNWAYPTTEGRLVGNFFFKVAGSSDVGVKSYQVLATEMPPPSLFCRAILIWHLSSSCCRQACKQVHRNAEERNRGECSFVNLFINLPCHIM